MAAVTGIVLAAGRSSRMGRDKALLPFRGRTFLELAAGCLQRGGCDGLVVVVRRGAEEVVREAQRLDVTVVVNREAESEQVDSLRLGLSAADPAATAALVLPVDHPLVRQETVRALLRCHHREPDAIVRPIRADQPGHPTLFPRAVWHELANEPLPRGARTVVESPESTTLDLPVDDDGVVADIDTPTLYRALQARGDTEQIGGIGS